MQLTSLNLVRRVMLSLMFVGSVADVSAGSRSECVCRDERRLIAETEALVIERAKLEIPRDLTWNAPQRAISLCALLSFSISDDGRADQIAVVRSFPQHLLSRSAVRALKEYEFEPAGPSGRRMLLFTYRLEIGENAEQ